MTVSCVSPITENTNYNDGFILLTISWEGGLPKSVTIICSIRVYTFLYTFLRSYVFHIDISTPKTNLNNRFSRTKAVYILHRHVYIHDIKNFIYIIYIHKYIQFFRIFQIHCTYRCLYLHIQASLYFDFTI